MTTTEMLVGETLAADINRITGICHEEMSGNGRWCPSPSRPMKELGANSVLEKFAFLHRSLGDAMQVLKTLPNAHFHCCVTSPPYQGLRGYGTGLWHGDNQEQGFITKGRNLPHCRLITAAFQRMNAPLTHHSELYFTHSNVRAACISAAQH